MAMRLKTTFRLIAAGGLLFLTGGPASQAQNQDSRYPIVLAQARQAAESAPVRRQTYQGRPSEFRRSRGDRNDRQAPPPAPPQQTFFNPFAALFGAISGAPAQQRSVAPEPRLSPSFEEPRRRVVRPRAPVKEAAKPKSNVTTSVVVFGDSLAELVGQGLDEGFEEARQVAIVRRTRPESGLVDTESYDWPKAVRDFLASPQKITFAVLMLGANDHEPIEEGEATHDLLSERWRQLYAERLDAVLQLYKDKNVPVVFVGAPPMRNEKLSADQIAINEIARARVQRAGGTYVDIWPAFVDDQNRYAQSGPNLAGQVARLRLDDGVHFTRAGARKAAHFAEIEIRRLIEATQNPQAVAKTEEPAPTNLAALAVPDVAPVLPVKPVVGPVLPLTRVEISAGGVLAGSRARASLPGPVERAFGEGAPPPPQTGRADDFRWPRS